MDQIPDTFAIGTAGINVLNPAQQVDKVGFIRDIKCIKMISD